MSFKLITLVTSHAENVQTGSVERVKCTAIERVRNGWSTHLKWVKLNAERLTGNFERAASNAERLSKNFERLAMSSRTAH